MVGGKPADVLNGPLPAGVHCYIMQRVPDYTERIRGTRNDWIAWIREVARIGGAPDYCIYEPTDPLAGIEAGAYQWTILTKPIRWLTYELRSTLRLGDYEHDSCTCPTCLAYRTDPTGYVGKA
jgi:hypothetical protein